MMPVMQPISKPPTLARTSSPSPASGRFTRRAWRTTSIFTFNRASEILVPRPVAASGDRSQNTAATQAEEVVLAMPISPGKKQRTPFFTPAAASSMPISMASTAWRRLMAGPLAQFLVPKAIFFGKRPGRCAVGAAMPKSATMSSDPAKLDRALATAPREIR